MGVRGENGTTYVLIIAGIFNFITYWLSDKIILKMYRARKVAPGEAPESYEIVGELANTANPLRKLDAGAKGTPLEANPSTAHLFIVNTLRGRGLMNFFSPNPPIQERNRRLEEMTL